MAPIVHDFLDLHGNKVSVNGVSYLNLLQEVVWPRLHSQSFSPLVDGRWGFSSLHEWSFSFLEQQIWRSSHQPKNWSSLASAAHSPDLNLLDFNFWAAAQSQVNKEKPDLIDSLVHCVKTFIKGYSQEITRKVCANVLKRAMSCLQAEGEHFQQLL